MLTLTKRRRVDTHDQERENRKSLHYGLRGEEGLGYNDYQETFERIGRKREGDTSY